MKTLPCKPEDLLYDYKADLIMHEFVFWISLDTKISICYRSISKAL